MKRKLHWDDGKKPPKRYIRKVITALEKLLKFYQRRKMHSIDSCPLCDIADCKNCVWMWFTRDGCCASSSTVVSNTRLRTNRKAQIKRWIKRLREEL